MQRLSCGCACIIGGVHDRTLDLGMIEPDGVADLVKRDVVNLGWSPGARPVALRYGIEIQGNHRLYGVFSLRPTGRIRKCTASRVAPSGQADADVAVGTVRDFAKIQVGHGLPCREGFTYQLYSAGDQRPSNVLLAIAITLGEILGRVRPGDGPPGPSPREQLIRLRRGPDSLPLVDSGGSGRRGIGNSTLASPVSPGITYRGH